MVKKTLFSICNIFFFTLVLNFSSAWSLDSLTTDNTVPLKVENFQPSEAVFKTPRIIGGVEADEDDWPWMAALVYAGLDAYNGQFCGGSLIADQWIVTAAHCTEGSSPEDIEVILGAHNLSEDEGQRFTVDEIIEHENYDPRTIDSDIALLHLSEASTQNSIELVEQSDPDGLTTPFTNATVIGWGSTDPLGYRYPEELRQVSVPIIPGRVGVRIYGAETFTINMLVAGLRRGGKDSCSGDSGGPLMVRDTSGTDWVLAGITSWGIGCARPRYPGVYTRASRYTSWVESKIEDDNQNEPTGECGAYVAPGVWKEFDCYNLAAIGKTTGDDPFTPSWSLIGGYWQWGRKGPDSSQWYDTNTEHFAHGPTGTDSGEANSEEISNWDDDYAPDGAWSDESKTSNDPCPDGYRMPTESQWQGVIDNNTQSAVGTWDSDDTNYSSAWFFGDDLMLPASGYRYYSSGSLTNRGYGGGYWSSTQSTGNSAWYLLFYSGYATTGNGYRRYGFSVRCVAE